MTTKLTKPVRREIDGMIIELAPAGVTTWEKGKRTKYGPIRIRAIHHLGAKLHAQQQLAEKKPKRKRTSSLKVGI
jgi:hypothetical protein